MLAIEYLFTRPRWMAPSILVKLIDTQSSLDFLGVSDLHEAILAVDGASSFKSALQSTLRDTIDERDVFERTALHWASFLGNVVMIKELLNHGADPDSRDVRGFTHLHLASMSYKFSSLCVKALLEAGAHVDMRDNRGISALSFSVFARDEDINAVNTLLDFGADISSRSLTGKTPLLYAVKANNLIFLSYLITRGADTSVENYNGDSTLDLAILHKSHECLELLVDQVPHTMFDGFIFIAALFADVKTLKTLRMAKLKNIDIHSKPRRFQHWEDTTTLWVAEWRRDYNIEWSRLAPEMPDEDPEAWFTAFMELLYSIDNSENSGLEIWEIKSDTELSEEDTEEFSDTGLDDDSEKLSDTGSNDDLEELSDTGSSDETWKDAQESLQD